jgi:hypothetical protein
VSPVRYELGLYIPDDDILHSHRRENLRSHTLSLCPSLHVSHPYRTTRKITNSAPCLESAGSVTGSCDKPVVAKPSSCMLLAVSKCYK